MGKTSNLRIAEIRAIYQLASECRDLGDDPHRWRTHFAERLSETIGADLMFCVETAGCKGKQPQDLGVAEWGWESGFNRAGWLRALQEFQHNPFYSLGLQQYFRRFRKEDGVTHSRRDLVADARWNRSFDRRVIHRAIGVDHVAWCFRTLRQPADEQAGVIALREEGSRDFAEREKAVLAAAQATIAPMIGGPLARFGEPAPSTLPPRVRQVLCCLLEGDGDKQTALRLGISPMTVNVYTKQIFRHFVVKSRAELLARWIRRGWGAGNWKMDT
jgi:DNA-binding CsgD family transcriptional regulator